jgi:hypothetical protein
LSPSRAQCSLRYEYAFYSHCYDNHELCAMRGTSRELEVPAVQSPVSRSYALGALSCDRRADIESNPKGGRGLWRGGMEAVNTQEQGTPAALNRLAAHELECANEVQRHRDTLDKLRAEPEPSPNDAERDAKLSSISAQISRTLADLGNAQDAWIRSLRALREFDKAVPKSTREGEKISVAEAKEAFEQLRLSIFLGVDAFILQSAADALRCENEMEFHKMSASKIRGCVTQQIESAKREGVLPPWVN